MFNNFNPTSLIITVCFSKLWPLFLSVSDFTHAYEEQNWQTFVLFSYKFLFNRTLTN